MRSWTAEAIELLKGASDLTVQEILGGVDTIRKRFDPVMVRVATTEPAGEYKQAAIMLLMGAAVSRLNDARTLFAQLP